MGGDDPAFRCPPLFFVFRPSSFVFRCRPPFDSLQRLRQEPGVESNPLQLAIASAILALSVVIIWFGAPVVPSLLGAVLAALFVYWRGRRRQR